MQTVASLRDFFILVGSKVLAPLFPFSFIYFQPIVSLHRLFTALPACVFIEALEKYTTSRLIISRPVEGSPFLLCGPRCSLLKKIHHRCWKTVISLAVTVKWHSPRLSAAVRHMPWPRCWKCLKLRRGLWFKERRGSWCLCHTASTTNAFQNPWSRNMSCVCWTWDLSASTCRCVLDATNRGALQNIPCMLSSHLEHICGVSKD